MSQTTEGTGAGAQSPPDPSGPPAGAKQLSHREILIVIGGLMTGMFLAALDQSIVGTALPRIVSELGGLDKLSWVVTAYLLTTTAATPLWGKISDLYGRRLIFQAAIVIFVLGSTLSGVAQDMGQLIAFRAVQGLGGGGLMAIALATVGDVIPARDRGRYQGYFGAVFGLSSVVGPLLGGWLTDGPGWRWIFFINIPIGLVALVATSMALRLEHQRREHKIDYTGAALIVAAVASVLLYLDWRGQDYGWTEGYALALLGAAAVLTALFIYTELHAAEPIIPMRLFRNSIFTVSNIYSFLTGMAMFGALIFLPLYLQAVKGYSPTTSGLALIPAVVGIFTTSIGVGKRISTTGKYRKFPIIGSAIIVGAFFLLAQLKVDSPYWFIALGAYVFGVGLGCTMQTTVLAVQNSVDFRDMGVGTSAVTFFRSMGGAIGTAVFGAVLSSRLITHLQDNFAAAGGAPAGGNAAQVGDVANNVQVIQSLPPAIKAPVLEAFTGALHDVFLVGIPFVVVAFVVALFLKEIPLRTSIGNNGPTDKSDETLAVPAH